MAISLLILPIPKILALELSSPISVIMNEEFNVQISDNSTDTQDVKIFVENSSSKIISQTYNENIWKSSFYFVPTAFPEQKEFKIKIKQIGEWEICVKLRENKISSKPLCNPIIVEGAEVNEPTNDIPPQQTPQQSTSQSQEPSNNTEEQEKLETIVVQTETTSDFKPKKLQTQNLTNKKPQEEKELIVLNSKPEVKEDTSTTFTSKEEKTRGSIIYFFAGFCVLIIILLSLRKL